MDRLMCYFDNETAVPRGCCTFDRESNTEPDDCISCGEMCEEKNGDCSECPIQKAFNKLAEYEDLEEKLQEKYYSNITMKQIINDFLETIFKGESHDGFCILTNKDAQEWRQFKSNEEQGLIVRLPCKVGDTVYVVPSNTNYGINIVNGHQENNRVYYQKVCRIAIGGVGTYSLITCEGMGIVTSEFFGETWFLTEDEAKDKLEELDTYWKNQMNI